MLIDILRIDDPLIFLVVGPYHSGKSYLLNQLLQRQNAFDIGSSVDPKTRVGDDLMN